MSREFATGVYVNVSVPSRMPSGTPDRVTSILEVPVDDRVKVAIEGTVMTSDESERKMQLAQANNTVAV